MIFAYPDSFNIYTDAVTTYALACNMPCRDDYLKENDLISMPIRIQYIVSSVNLSIQLLFIIFILMKGYLKKGPFFRILLFFSCTVTFRIVYYTVSLYLATKKKKTQPATNRVPSDQSDESDPSIYVDYGCNLFSIIIVFFLSLNRCLSFVAKTWNQMFFKGINALGSILLCIIVSVLGAVAIIKTSKVLRSYFLNFGFLDVGPVNIGYKVSINRLFNLFSIGSVICYIVLYHHFRKQSRNRSVKTVFMKRGEQQVFSQLLITASLYLFLNVVYELITMLEWKKDDTWLLLYVEILAIANYLPEMALPLSVIIGSMEVNQVVRKLFQSKGLQDRVSANMRSHI